MARELYTINTVRKAVEVADEIFKWYQCGMGTTNHPVAISVEDKPQLIKHIQEVLEKEPPFPQP